MTVRKNSSRVDLYVIFIYEYPAFFSVTIYDILFTCSNEVKQQKNVEKTTNKAHFQSFFQNKFSRRLFSYFYFKRELKYMRVLYV